MSASLSDASPAPKRIEFEDPHAGIGNLQEAEVTRVRMLRGGWRWALVVATAATILLCINQQFSLRFFIDYTQLNTEYFYLLIALMLPFTFLIFPGTENAPLDRIPWYDLVLFVATFAASIWLMLNVRKAAQFGWESDGAPQNIIAAGLVMWFVLMEALRRTGGWSLLLSVLPFTVYPLFAEASWLGPFRGSQLTLDQTTAYHVLSGESLLGIPIQAFADTVIGFLQIADAGVRILEFDSLWRSHRTIGRRHRSISNRSGFAFDFPPSENDGYCSKPFGILALANAAARAVIQPSRNALSSDGGLALP